MDSSEQDLIEHADTLIGCIEQTLQYYDPSTYYDQLIPVPGHISLRDCEIPDFIEDPFGIIRHVRGEARAEWLEYEDDLEAILQEIEECRAQLRNKGAGHVEGDEKGAEQAGGEAVQG